jgi:hypothetical protein
MSECRQVLIPPDASFGLAAGSVKGKIAGKGHAREAHALQGQRGVAGFSQYTARAWRSGGVVLGIGELIFGS